MANRKCRVCPNPISPLDRKDKMVCSNKCAAKYSRMKNPQQYKTYQYKYRTSRRALNDSLDKQFK